MTPLCVRPLMSRKALVELLDVSTDPLGRDLQLPNSMIQLTDSMLQLPNSMIQRFDLTGLFNNSNLQEANPSFKRLF